MAKGPNASGIVSIRLTAAERQLIEDAAAKKGWKAATFIRVAALERAAHVINLSRPTSFDFSRASKRLAEALVAPRSVEIYDTGSPTMFGRFGEGQMHDRVTDHDAKLAWSTLTDFQPAPFTRDEIANLSEAVRLGGLDFAAQLLMDCQRLASTPSDPDLPAPIDPASIEEQEPDEEDE